MTSIHGCKDSLFIDSTIVVNDLNPTIETLDTLICFNGDSVLNVQDVVILINFILGSADPTDQEYYAGDINSDGILNVQDVVILINMILG